MWSSRITICRILLKRDLVRLIYLIFKFTNKLDLNLLKQQVHNSNNFCSSNSSTKETCRIRIFKVSTQVNKTCIPMLLSKNEKLLKFNLPLSYQQIGCKCKLVQILHHLSKLMQVLNPQRSSLKTGLVHN